MYICIYICISIYLFIYLYLYICIYINTCKKYYTHHAYMYYTNVHHVHMHIQEITAHARTHTCIYVNACTRIYLSHIYTTHTYMYCTNVSQTWTSCPYVHTRNDRRNTYKYVCIYKCLYLYICLCVYLYLDLYLCICIYIYYMYIHT